MVQGHGIPGLKRKPLPNLFYSVCIFCVYMFENIRCLCRVLEQVIARASVDTLKIGKSLLK